MSASEPATNNTHARASRNSERGSQKRIALARGEATRRGQTAEDRWRVFEHELRRLGTSESEISAAVLREIEAFDPYLRAKPDKASAKAALRARVSARVPRGLASRDEHQALLRSWRQELLDVAASFRLLSRCISSDVLQMETLALVEAALGAACVEFAQSIGDSVPDEHAAETVRLAADAMRIMTHEGRTAERRRLDAVRVAEQFGGRAPPERPSHMTPEERSASRAISRAFALDPGGTLRRRRLSWGVTVREFLAETDPAFAKLHPARVVEALANARRGAGGRGRTGPLRALAELSVACGAFGDDCTTVTKALGAFKTAASRERRRLGRWLHAGRERQNQLLPT